MKNEKTSKRVARIAGKVLALKGKLHLLPSGRLCDYHFSEPVTRAELRALAASALTQAPDKKPAKRKAKRR